MKTVTSFNLHPSLGTVKVEVHRALGPDDFNVNIRADGHGVTIFFKSIEDLSAFADELGQRVLNVRFQDQWAVRGE